MSDLFAAIGRVQRARAGGEFALALLLHQAIQIAPPSETPEERSIRLFALSEWGLLAAAYAPARQALQALRNKEAAQLASGTEPRMQVIVEINRHIGDPQHTLALFRQLDTQQPDIARRLFHVLADVLLECEAVDILQRYLPEPQEGMRYRAQYLDSMANERIPRRWGEAQAFVNDLRLQCGVLALLGKTTEANALKTMAVALIQSDEARQLVETELEEPGEIGMLMAEWQARQDQTGPSDLRQ